MIDRNSNLLINSAILVIYYVDRKHSDELLSRSGIKCVENKIQRAKLRWFGHVEWKEENDWAKKCTRMNVTGVVGFISIRW